MKLNAIFKFGKYKDHQVEDVIEDDPGYIRWLIDKKDFKFHPDVMAALAKREARRT